MALPLRGLLPTSKVLPQGSTKDDEEEAHPRRPSRAGQGMMCVRMGSLCGAPLPLIPPYV